MKIFRILLLVLVVVLAGCAGNKAVKTDAPEEKGEKTFMWEIKGGESKLYLLGSIHLMPESVYPLKEVITNAFEESDVLVVEADATKIDQNRVQKLVMESSMYKDGKTLKSELSPELYARLGEELNKLNMSIEQFNMFKPWYLSLTLSMLEIQKAGMKPELGIDMHLLAKANEKEKEIVELESAYGQLELLTTIPDESQEGYLEYTLDNFANTKELMDIMVKAWISGDAKTMYESTKGKMKEQAESEGDMEFYNRLFPDRDAKMAVKIDEMLKSKDGKTYFVVIGAGHLIGDDGQLKRLRDLGYTTIQK